MICRFATQTADPHLHECLEDLPGILTAYAIEFHSAEGLPWYLVGAVGFAASQDEWTALCTATVLQATLLIADVRWMVEDLSIEGI